MDPKDYRFRDKVLEAVGDRGDQMNEGVFIRLLSEHEILIEDIRAGETSRPSTWNRGSTEKLTTGNISAQTETSLTAGNANQGSILIEHVQGQAEARRGKDQRHQQGI